MFPFLFNGMINGNNNRNIRNKRTNNNNQKVNNDFNTIFNSMFTTMVNDTGLINNIVDSVINSDVFSSMLTEVDNENLKIKEYNDKYVIEGNFPGINKKDIDIDYDKDRITIKVSRNKVYRNNTNTMVAFIQEGGDLVKSFYVPNTEESQIKAAFHSNILRICLPKQNVISEEGTIIDVDNFTET